MATNAQDWSMERAIGHGLLILIMPPNHPGGVWGSYEPPVCPAIGLIFNFTDDCLLPICYCEVASRQYVFTEVKANRHLMNYQRWHAFRCVNLIISVLQLCVSTLLLDPYCHRYELCTLKRYCFCHAAYNFSQCWYTENRWVGRRRLPIKNQPKHSFYY